MPTTFNGKKIPRMFENYYEINVLAALSSP